MTTHLQSKSRKKEIVFQRRQLAIELREQGLSLPKIGKILNRNHTTILYYLRTPDSEKYKNMMLKKHP